MQAKRVLDTIEQVLQNQVTGKLESPERTVLLSWLELALNALAARDDFDFFETFLNPLIRTNPNSRSYPLPQDFGNNFSKVDDRHLCKASDGNTEWLLRYETPKRFFERDMVTERASRPLGYTITTSAGLRLLWLKPAPNDTEYLIGGLYKPSNFTLTEESDVPPIPNGIPYLTFYMLTLLDPQNPAFQQRFRDAERGLYLAAARDRAVQVSPESETLRTAGVGSMRRLQ